MDELQSGDPRRIGPYWLERRLGSGGMGRVYLGRSPGGRQVAIKLIRPELAEDADFRARFAREVSAAKKVSGIYTASVVDADLDGPVPWLATSYIAGPSLADAVATRGPLPESMVLRLAAGLAEGERIGFRERDCDLAAGGLAFFRSDNLDVQLFCELRGEQGRSRAGIENEIERAAIVHVDRQKNERLRSASQSEINFCAAR